jgi:hypothetical protein
MEKNDSPKLYFAVENLYISSDPNEKFSMARNFLKQIFLSFRDWKLKQRSIIR